MQVRSVFGIPYDNKNPSSTITAAIGANPNDNVVIPKFNVTTAMQDSTGKILDSVDVMAPNSVDSNLNVIDSALSSVLHASSIYGGIENRFSDTDIAAQISEYAKDGVLVDAGIAMMVQTNKLPQDILNILSRVK